MEIRVILVIAFFMILVSIQYTLNKILLEVKRINKVLEKNHELEYKGKRANNAEQKIH